MEAKENAHGAEHGAKRRLVIKEMCLENFKSYGGVQRIGPFHQCFSSVVGPNGSGKSNVIDAMLFVFGKRASKLRLNKVSELIHNSTSFKNLKHCRVDVYFHEIEDVIPGETFEVIPGTDLKVSRAAYRDNSSDYFLNDKRSSFQEVTKVLKSKHIDLNNNRFLILQGEVEQISLMPPKSQHKNEDGLLEYLEDIIGTNVYVDDINTLSDELQVMNEQRSGIIQRVKVVQKEKDALESSAQEAQIYLDKEKALLRTKVVGYRLLLRNTETAIAEAEEEQREVNERLAEEQAKWSEVAAQIKQSEKECKVRKKQQGAIQAELESVNKDFSEFERKDIKLREDLKHLKQKQKKVEEKLRKEQKNKEKLAKQIGACQSDIPQLEKGIENATKRLAYEQGKLEKMQDSFKDEIGGHREKLERINLELAPWEKQKNEVQGEIDVATAELRIIEDKASGAAKRLQSTQQAIEEATALSTTKAEESAALAASLKQKQSDLEAAMKASEALEKEYKDTGSKMQASRGRVEERKSAMNTEQSKSQVVKALVAAQAAGKLRGVHGRLGDLGATEAKYDVAISTACPGLDHIVVESVTDAQACVQFLKRHELGRATFLILEKQRALEQRMEATLRVAAPAGSVRLLDLIKMKNAAHKVAFYYALRDTVLAQSLEDAQSFAYKQKTRWRVVTLQGQVIELSGTMSGGGKPRKGRILVGSAARVASNGEDLSQLVVQAEEEYTALARCFERIKEKRAATLSTIEGAEKAIGDLQVAAPKARMEADAAAQEARELQGRLDELKAQCKVDPKDKKRAKELQATIDAAGAKIADLNASTSTLRGQAQALEATIDAVGGEALRTLRSQVKELAEQIETMHSDISKKQIQIASNEKLVAKSDKAFAKGTEEVGAMQTAVADAKAQIARIEEEAMSVMECKKKTEDVLSQKSDEVKAFEREQKQLKKELHAMKSSEVDIQHAKQEVDAKLKQHIKDKKGILKSIEQVRKEACTHANPTDDVDAEVPNGADVAADVAEPTAEELDGYDLDAIQKEASDLEAALADMKADLNAIAEYRAKQADFASRMGELNASTATRDGAKARYDALRKKRLDEFMAGFNVIALKLKEMYQMITLGGDAELELVDSLDPFSEGIVFSVRPPKKSWKNIRNLSGGEKTLSSLALVFALHHYKPTPLYVMDEIDAALDFRNVSIVAHYIKERTKNAQFVIISLRNNMFELADRLVGIYKTHNTTKSVTIDPDKFEVPAKPLSVS